MTKSYHIITAVNIRNVSAFIPRTFSFGLVNRKWVLQFKLVKSATAIIIKFGLAFRQYFMYRQFRNYTSYNKNLRVCICLQYFDHRLYKARLDIISTVLNCTWLSLQLYLYIVEIDVDFDKNVYIFLKICKSV